MAQEQGYRSQGEPQDGGARQSFAEVKDEAASLADRAKQEGKAMASRKKDAAAGQADSAAQALHRAADELQGSQHPQAGRYVGFAAEQLEGLGRRLRDTDIDGLIADADALSRRSPVAFFAGSIAAGFLVSRFLKSSADRRHAPPTERQADLGSGTVRWRAPEDPTHQDLLDPDGAAAASAGEAYRHEAEPYVVDRTTAGVAPTTTPEASPFPTTQRMPRDTGDRHDY